MKTVSEQARDLVAENDQRRAADLMLEAFRDRDAELANLARVQQANIKKLADQTAAGVWTTDEIRREQSKISVALLHLADEFDRLYGGSLPEKTRQVKPVLGIVAALLVLAVAGWLVFKTGGGETLPETFDLEVRLHESAGENRIISQGNVNIRFGEAVPQAPQVLDADGKVVFRDLSSKYRGDSIHLLFFPPEQRRFVVRSQSAAVLTGRNQTVRFGIVFIPDTTVLEMTLFDAKQRRVSQAQVIIDGKWRYSTDENGYFRAPLPMANGQTADVVVEKDGKRLFKQDLVISPGLKTLPLE